MRREIHTPIPASHAWWGETWNTVSHYTASLIIASPFICSTARGKGGEIKELRQPTWPTLPIAGRRGAERIAGGLRRLNYAESTTREKETDTEEEEEGEPDGVNMKDIENKLGKVRKEGGENKHFGKESSANNKWKLMTVGWRERVNRVMTKQWRRKVTELRNKVQQCF